MLYSSCLWLFDEILRRKKKRKGRKERGETYRDIWNLLDHLWMDTVYTLHSMACRVWKVVIIYDLIKSCSNVPFIQTSIRTSI